VATHGVVLTTALAVAVSLPLIAAMVLRTGDLTVRRAWLQRSRAVRPALRDLDRGVIAAAPEDIMLPDTTGPDDAMPPLDQVAAQLQRLYRQRTNGTARGSMLLDTALADAYDAWLQVACRYYNVTHHLPTLANMDRDIERVRVEELLTEAGFRLPPR
jgi:hypothetical protein